jgi:hypothetical protein
MPPFKVIRHERKTDKPGVFNNGIGLEEMRAGEVTYIIAHKETGLFFKYCTRFPAEVWIDPNQDVQEGPNWFSDKERTAVAYDWFEDMQ